ncbi:hypothetical protein [Paenibacillus sp. IHBB 3054]|uniref:hypothetical protein n=1 Tax=Paenibacillus sp. IHBB 3054 TaxID=3425689 RepID=UPI003F6707A8
MREGLHAGGRAVQSGRRYVRFTLLPIRFVSENMKMKVFFDEGKIVITDAAQQ